MISDVDLPIYHAKNDQVRIFEKSNFSQIVNFRRAKIGPLNEIQNAIYRVYSESARQGLSESVKKNIGGQKPPLMQIILCNILIKLSL